ncbi:MAG TPA: hypothetical protein VHE35_16630, partial [Kofleriaceae bacterium]|nr:hypothetical protein [Kofleriaceae bacterium]
MLATRAARVTGAALVAGALGLAAVGSQGCSACSGSGASGKPEAHAHDGGAGAAAEPVLDVAVRPLGKASLDDYAWRRGPGKPMFDRALAAERRGDLATVERECAAALAADPGHLEAAWMLAVARVRQGELEQVLAPLEIAAAGDWAKWGERSLELAVFAPFRATAAGKGWVRAADRYRAALAAALADGVIVVGRTQPFRPPRASGDVTVEHRAEAYAVSGGRWIRLTRTGGSVVGALPSPGRGALAYASYRDVVRSHEGKPRLRELHLGVVDLASGRAGRELVLGDVAQATLAWAAGGGEPQLVVELVPARGKPETFVVDDGSRKPYAGGLPRGEALRVRPLSAERRRMTVAGVTADWDELGTASAVRLDRSRKVIAPPGGALIDGDSLAWSPDQARLAFASVAEDPCGDAAARQVSLYVVDAGSGRVQSIATGDRVPSPVWLGPSRLAFVDGDAVRVVDPADGRELERLAGGGGVTTGVIGELRPCAVDTAGPFAEPDDSDDEPEVDDLAPA